MLQLLSTIKVLELKVPHKADLSVLKGISPIFFCYVLSSINMGIFLKPSSSPFSGSGIYVGKVSWADMHFCLDYLITFFFGLDGRKQLFVMDRNFIRNYFVDGDHCLCHINKKGF